VYFDGVPACADVGVGFVFVGCGVFVGGVDFGVGDVECVVVVVVESVVVDGHPGC